MNSKQILLVGVKGSVLAFHRETGEHLWAAELKSSSTSDFVSFASDDTRIYAHTGGELFCLELKTGRKLWHDRLKGFGYGIASLGFPGSTPASAAAAEAIRQAAAAASAATTTATSTAT